MNKLTFDEKVERGVLLYFFKEYPTPDRESRLKIFYLKELEKVSNTEKRNYFQNIFNEWDNILSPQKKADMFISLWQYAENQPEAPSLSGIPFLEGGRDGFLNNLQILTDAGHITLVKNKFTIQATNKASAHRMVESIFINAVDMGFIQNFFFKEDGKKIRWAHITKNFNYQIPKKEISEFSNIELFKQFDYWFNVYSADREKPLHDTRTLESMVCDEFKLITALTKRK